MQVAVSSVSVTDGPETVHLAQGFDRLQQRRQLPARHDRVLFLVHALRLHCFAHPPSQEPELLLFSGALREQDFTGVVHPQHREHAFTLRHEVVLRKGIDFNQQVRFVVGLQDRLMDICEILGQKHGVTLHEFQSTRHRPGLKQVCHSRTRIFGRLERNQHQRLVRGQREQFQRRLGHNAQGPFAAHHELSQIVARRILQRVGPRLHHRAVGQHNFKIEDPVLRHAVFHRAWPSTVFRQIAPDCARASRRRVHRVHQSMRGGGVGQFFGDHPWLHHRLVVQGVDRHNSIHASGAQQNAPLHGKRAPTQPCARASGGDRHIVVVGVGQDPRHFCRAHGLHHRVRHKHQILCLVRRVVAPGRLSQMHPFRGEEGLQIFRIPPVLVSQLFHARCVILGACQK